MIRSPIVSVLGHVDHGKTSILDAVRESRVALKEPGRITQMIGASYISKETIESLSKGLAKALNIKLIIPGLLFIDTPGHEAFTSLRQRGGSIADIAILVVDVMQGFQPQTIEAINILKTYKTPFVVAANKIDLIKGWKPTEEKSFLKSLAKQSENAKRLLDEKIYNIVNELAMQGLDSERFDRVSDFTKSVAIIPVSAKTKEGLAELLLLVAGLSQKYLKDKLFVSQKEKAKGTILEVKEEKGLGTTLDAIIYDGVLREGERIYFLTKNGISSAKVRALLMPNVASNNPKEKYKRVKEVVAAAGVKIAGVGLEGAIAGSPLSSSPSSLEDLANMLSSLIFEAKDKVGVIAKADSLGSLEALIKLFGKNNIPIYKADIGSITKEDLLLAESLAESFPYSCVVAFNVPVSSEALDYANREGVKIIANNIIYKLVEAYEEYVKEVDEKQRRELSKFAFPSRIRVLRGFFFRMSKPAIFGIEVEAGRIKPGIKLMNREGIVLGELKTIQEKKESLKEATKGMKVAISVDGAVLGKDIKEEDILYPYIPLEGIEEWLSKSHLLSEEEREVAEEIRRILIKAKAKRKLS